MIYLTLDNQVLFCVRLIAAQEWAVTSSGCQGPQELVSTEGAAEAFASLGHTFLYHVDSSSAPTTGQKPSGHEEDR